VCLGKGIMAMCHCCKERSSVQRKCSLVLDGVAVRDHTGGIQAETSFMDGETELHAHERVVVAHRGRCVGVGRWEDSD
jgi:hypothetical protein